MNTDHLKKFGYWKSDCRLDAHLPNPVEFVDVDWSADERDDVLLAIGRAAVANRWKGWSNCRMCGKMNGSACMTLNGWVFPEGLAHYIRDHGVRPPNEFVSSVLNRNIKPMGFYSINKVSMERVFPSEGERHIRVQWYDDVLQKWDGRQFAFEEAEQAAQFALEKFSELSM